MHFCDHKTFVSSIANSHIVRIFEKRIKNDFNKKLHNIFIK